MESMTSKFGSGSRSENKVFVNWNLFLYREWKIKGYIIHHKESV